MAKARTTLQPRRAASDAYAALSALAGRLPEAIAQAVSPKVLEASA